MTITSLEFSRNQRISLR